MIGRVGRGKTDRQTGREEEGKEKKRKTTKRRVV